MYNVWVLLIYVWIAYVVTTSLLFESANARAVRVTPNTALTWLVKFDEPGLTSLVSLCCERVDLQYA